eukprot:TRINITY_DN2166_c0_g1_i5.p1 TRINITY_DN2166_c0_g1~~TRINITY_DN2166_c0_g1_i5.p1  ORF type:complete len:190 (+),score=32.41 TRINITY_DN2166_c0_g1_i5:101-670(+)
MSITTDYYLPGEKEERYRVSFDEKKRAVTSALTKQILLTKDIALRTKPFYLYDLRVSVAGEYPEEVPEAVPNATEPGLVVRKKERWSFVDSAHELWRIDMTRVTNVDSATGQAQEAKTFEIELELMPHVIPRLCSTEYSKIVCESLWKGIHAILREIKRVSSPHTLLPGHAATEAHPPPPRPSQHVQPK